MMKKIIFLIPLIFIIVAVALLSKTSDKSLTLKNTTPTPTKAVSDASFPEQAVLNFYDPYIKFQGNGFASKIYESNPYLTVNLKKKLDNLQTQTLIYDPIICAQNTPLSIKIDKAERQDKQYLVKLAEVYGSGQVVVSVTLVKEGNIFKINDIACTNS